MRSSSRMNLEPDRPTGTNLGTTDGTLIRTKRGSKRLLPRDTAFPSGASTINPRLRLNGEMYGKGCDGSTANGVRIGKTFSRKYSSRLCFSYLVSELYEARSRPPAFSVGKISSLMHL